ncbi:Na+/H+ antiporter NhaA [uncultured Bacteroides sp.]|uniref:Na+/H+ antiporter NhaA n=1 Tax=uncultured Bacteroides sp. TaxID=162156 RepID=UPI002AA83F0F|nr:Na+/H+ antiporter NhaA [uncultured Bacteroides sp.]
MANLKIKPFAYSFESFLKHYVNGGMLLMVVALLAMVVANSPLSEAYTSFWNYPVSLQIGDFNLFSHHGEPMTLMAFINDALMAIFFFSVGLEIKRETLVGELSSFRQALMPIIAACGGMIIPVIIYSLMITDGIGHHGLAIPMATDIAFSLGVLSLLGKRVPLSLKIFLTAFAVVDDIGGIIVIALFYATNLEFGYLLAAAVIIVMLFFANIKLEVVNKAFYIFWGIVVWYLFLQSGIHSTVAGVLVAFTIPSRPNLMIGKYIERIRENIHSFPVSKKESILLDHNQLESLKSIESSSDHVISPLQSMEDALQAPVNYLIMPLFAFANAGVVFSGGGNEIVGEVTYAVASGLLFGKFIGIFSFTWLAVKLKIGSLPEGMCWKNLAGVSMLGGIGFTVALFIANLSFGSKAPELLNQAKFGIICGTVLSGIIGYIYLSKVLPKENLTDAENL